MSQEFEYYIEDHKIKVSKKPESPIENTLVWGINIKPESAACEVDMIELCLPIGEGETDFAKKQDIEGICVSRIRDGWSVSELTPAQFDELRAKIRSGKIKREDIARERICYVCRREEEGEEIFTFMAYFGWSFKENPLFEAELTKVVTYAAEGTTYITCKVYQMDEEDPISTYAYPIIKQTGEARILDFYPEKGAAYAGEAVQLNWRTEGIEELVLETPDGRISPEKGASSCYVSPKETARYRLRAEKDGEILAQRETVVQVLWPFLKEFRINEEKETVEWDVLCAKDVKINGREVSAKNSRSLEQFACPGKITLTAGNEEMNITSVLYYGTLEERKTIVHFRKTFMHYKDKNKNEGVQILGVSWKLNEENEENEELSVRLVYQDRARNELYLLGGKDTLEREGYWEQLLADSEYEEMNESILITMDACCSQNGTRRTYEITI